MEMRRERAAGNSPGQNSPDQAMGAAGGSGGGSCGVRPKTPVKGAQGKSRSGRSDSPSPKPGQKPPTIPVAVAVDSPSYDGKLLMTQAALDDLERDRYAPTTTRSRAAWLRTWVVMHEAAYRTFPVPSAPFPLSCDCFRRVASLFKAGGYELCRKSKVRTPVIGAPGPWSMVRGAQCCNGKCDPFCRPRCGGIETIDSSGCRRGRGFVYG